jgi:predicted DNA-binding transcriptional regulator AlpA
MANGGSPTLDEVAKNPAAAADLPLDALAALQAQCAAAQGAIAAAMLAHPGAPASPAPDCLVTAEQAAERLAVSKDWLYRAAKDLPFTVRLGADMLRFSAAGIDRYIRIQLLKAVRR